MSIRRWLSSRLSLLLKRRARENDLKRELESHLKLEAEEQQANGVAPEEAPFAARRAFGNSTSIVEDVRESWGLVWLDEFLRDVRYGARSLRKSPGFTTVAVLTLALGIGANTAVFSAIDALMLAPLPFTDSDHLVRIYSIQKGMTNTFGNPDGPSWLDVDDFAKSSHSFQKVVAYDVWRKNVSLADSPGEPEQMRVGLVPAAYFEVLEIQPIMGRLFTEEENREGKNYVAAISARLWRNRFASDPNILGRKIRINAEPYVVVAVMPDIIPEWMERGQRNKIWTPFASSGVWPESSRSSRGYAVLARLKTGVSVDQAQADLSVIAAALAAEHPVDEGVSVAVKKLADTRAGALRPMMLLLMGAVSLILLIACVNLANLLLARNSARQRELAVCTALGAGRRGLVRQLLAETLLLSLTGGAIGLLFARAGTAWLTRMHSQDLPQLASIGLDWRVLTFTLSASLITSLLFGLAPALTGTRVNLVDALKQGGRASTAGKSGKRTRNILVAAEIAMSLMLLVAASLLVQSVLRLERQDLGIRQDHLLRGRFYLPDTRYPNPGTITRFCDEFAERVGACRACSMPLSPPPIRLIMVGSKCSASPDAPSRASRIFRQRSSE